MINYLQLLLDNRVFVQYHQIQWTLNWGELVVSLKKCSYKRRQNMFINEILRIINVVSDTFDDRTDF